MEDDIIVRERESSSGYISPVLYLAFHFDIHLLADYKDE